MTSSNILSRFPSETGSRPPAVTVETYPTQGLLQELLETNLVLAEDWEKLSASDRGFVTSCRDRSQLLDMLVDRGLLTPYQSDRIAAGKTFGLILGHYRVLERIGAGGMGIVFKAEHIRLRQTVAIKVLPLFMTRDQSARNLLRFYAEVRAIAQLNHPNIVRAFDAGEVVSPDKDGPILHYYVMDYIDGRDLEDHVRAKGPLHPAEACDIICQIASALEEAHKHNLVHRDIKPSNILIAPGGKAMLLDFGLVREFRNRVTEPGTILGTVDYMAPEQAIDASTVDIRADIYSLGATLFWCLTARPPFQPKSNLAQEMVCRQTQPPPSARKYRTDLPPELDAVLARMMAVNPDDRYATPRAVVQVLGPFLHAEGRESLYGQPGSVNLRPGVQGLSNVLRSTDSNACLHQQRVLVVDDDSSIRNLCCLALRKEEILCDQADDGLRALTMIGSEPYDVVLLDMHMPGLSGREVCHRLRQHPPCPNLKIILLSGEAHADYLAQEMLAGADDFLAKPFTISHLLARVKTALRLKAAQDRTDLLTRNLLAINHQLEQSINVKDSDLIHARNALILALAELVLRRDAEANSAHLHRVQRYVRCLAEQAASMPAFANQIDPHFVHLLECCAPLKDIGKVGLPDHILLKPGKLDPDERIIMQSHTIIGAETLKKVAKQHGSAVAFLQMAIDIARHHHERYDGRGYPDRLSGNAIPLAARIVAICDVYDALRCRRTYRPALSHSSALQVILEASPGHFDPVLLTAFQKCADEFDRIFREVTE
ncbi:MAG: protein kinase [Gemmatales bacterium]|nr:protein kinase [Gemmatales bacterium]MDW8387222.1 protein kinase [Gemmatales bacterium]